MSASRSIPGARFASLGAFAALLAIVIALFGAFAGRSAAVGGSPPTVGSCTVYPPNTDAPNAESAVDQTAWNQDVTQAPVAKSSKMIIAQINRDGGRMLHPDFGTNPNFGIPFAVVEPDQPLVEVTIGPRGFPRESDFGPAPIPPAAQVEGGLRSKGDRHVIVVQDGSCGLYELYRAFPKAGAWQADSTAFFDLNQPAVVRAQGSTSADAAGLPVYPGLVRYDEVAAGAVNHAIRVTFDVTRKAYLPPATHDASDSCKRNRPAMGQRFRLKPGYYASHLANFPPGSQSRVIYEALYRYGMINADNGSNWFFSGAPDSRWDNEDLNRLKEIPGKAFAVVKSAGKLVSGC